MEKAESFQLTGTWKKKKFGCRLFESLEVLREAPSSRLVNMTFSLSVHWAQWTLREKVILTSREEGASLKTSRLSNNLQPNFFMNGNAFSSLHPLRKGRGSQCQVITTLHLIRSDY